MWGVGRLVVVVEVRALVSVLQAGVVVPEAPRAPWAVALVHVPGGRDAAVLRVQRLLQERVLQVGLGDARGLQLLQGLAAQGLAVAAT